MYRKDTEILFPMRVAPALRGLRGQQWQQLVDQVIASPDASLEQLAFSLVMIRLVSCLSCHVDSYRAIRGCTICAVRSVQRFHGQDEQLICLFQEARNEIVSYLEGV